ncbi:hypothetical protein DSM112329_03128 [Paraconexibacter sp. AEG42_29]|uniref:SGNH hydrolase-type esterase domain-containing protein n=1 Tax=Paraconexibacter sp. AEG42_29 TaxID=2997339 RepID=A0AAU7AX19_9ACTN
MLAVVVALTVLPTTDSGAALAPGDHGRATRAAPSACPPGVRPVQPAWSKGRRMTVIVDSVLLSGESALRAAMPGWVIKKRGRPALMIRVANRELQPIKRVNRLVVVAIGYNTLWQRGRQRYGYWAARFDREAATLLRTLRARGAEQIVWVNLRQPRPSTVPRSSVGDLSQYSWYFPYTNERLRALDRRNGDVVLADWRTAGDRPGVTYDTIHLNSRGGKLMAKTIKGTITAEARRQACGAGTAG